MAISLSLLITGNYDKDNIVAIVRNTDTQLENTHSLGRKGKQARCKALCSLLWVHYVCLSTAKKLNLLFSPPLENATR